MMESLYFFYDGIDSSDMGVIKVNSDGGLFEETFVAPKIVNTQRIRGRDKSYLLSVDREPLTFPLEIWFEQGLSSEKVDEIAYWIDQNNFKEMWFESNPERRVYAMIEGESSLIHNGIQEGYVRLNFITNSPYVYTPTYTDDYDISTNTAFGTDVTFINKGYNICKPILKIKKVGNGDISIINTSNGGKDLKITGLIDTELLTINNYNGDIETDLIATYRYKNHNNVFLELTRGYNYLKIYGNCTLEIIYHYELKSFY